MATLAQQAVTLLRKAEMSAVEHKYGISFGDDHRVLLSLAVPLSKNDVHVSNKWVDWRRGEETEIRRRLAWPLDGAVFDVFHDDFWPASWGPRPAVDDDELESQARHHMAHWPTLIPLYSHRYLPAAPAPLGSPVFSVMQTDVIHYGANLLDYLNNELGPSRRIHPPRTAPPLPAVVRLRDEPHQRRPLNATANPARPIRHHLRRNSLA